MRPGDEQACAAVFAESLNDLRRSRGLAPRQFVDGEASIRHLLATDPDGSFVAEESGEIVGFAQSARREDLWFLGKLFVRPAAQGAGAGKRLLDVAVAYGSDIAAGIICSSSDGRALGLYGRLVGFELHPMLTASGVARLDRITDATGVRPGTATDLEFAAEVDRSIRRGAHGPDLQYLLGRGSTLFIVNGRGYAVAGESGPEIVAALDNDAAGDLLRACLRSCNKGAAVRIPRIGSGHQWALRIALDAGLAISLGGAIVERNIQAASAAYLPNNVFC